MKNTNPTITLRLERPEDYPAVNALIREAFWGLHRPDCNEHLLAHKLRQSPSFVPELDYVAEVDGRLAGSILYTRARIVREDGDAVPVLCFGPLSVLPEYQSTGVGAALMRHTIGLARALGHRAIVIFGHPDYYPRFGFGRAADFGIRTQDGSGFDAFMALPLFEGALSDADGVFHEAPEFYALEESQLADFEQGFPPKERAVLTPTATLLEQLPQPARGAIEALGVPMLSHLAGKSQRELARLPGVDTQAIETIRRVMTEHGLRWGLPVGQPKER